MINFKDFIKEGKRGLWDNIHAKQKRIANGSGEHMRKPGSKGAPTADALKKSQTTSESWEKQAATAIAMKKAGKKPKHMSEELTLEEQFDLIEIMAEELAEETGLHIEQIWEELDDFTDEELVEACSCWKGYKRKPGTKPCDDGSCVKEETELAEDKMMPPVHKKVISKAGNHIGTVYKYDKPNALGYTHGASYHPHGGRGGASGVDWTHHETPESAEKTIHRQHGLYKAAATKALQKAQKHQASIPEETELDEAAVDAKGYKSSTGGLTQKGRDAYNSKGAHLQAPVTTPPSKLKKGSKAANRRKSFCARMGGMEGPMKKPNGEPTRKALALRKWNC